MNDTWSVRPVLSSTTGEYFAMSLGRYAGTDDVVQVVLGAKVSSRVLDAVLVHVRDHHVLALRTVRDQPADVGDAGRKRRADHVRRSERRRDGDAGASGARGADGGDGGRLRAAERVDQDRLADGEPDAGPADDLEVRVARRRGSGERRDVRLGVEPGADQSALLVVEETDLDRPLGVRAGGLVPAQQGLELGHAHRLAGPGVVHGAVAPVAAAHGARRRGAAGRGTVGDAGRGGRAVVVPGDQRRLAGARLATVAAGIYEVLSS